MTASRTRPGKRVKTPTVLQMEAVECGAASLAMILACYGRIVPLESLRSDCGVSRDGSKAANILRAARKHGMIAKGYSYEPEALRKMTFPVIVFWNFNHFLVVEGFKGGKVYLNDPADGPRVVSREDFDDSFTGIVLTFTPGPEFRKEGKKNSIFSSIKKRLANTGSALPFVVLAGLILVLPGLVVPVFAKIFVDNILVAHMYGWFKPLLLAMFLTFLLRTGVTWLQEYYLMRFETKLALTGSAKYFTHIFRLPIDFFTRRMAGDICSRIQLNDKVARLLSGDISVNVLNLMMVFFYAAMMACYDILLTAAGVGIACVNLFVLRLVSGKRKVLNKKLQQESGKLVGYSMAGLQMIETLKATGGESDFFAMWSGQLTKEINASQKLAVPSLILSTLPVFLMALVNAAVLIIGGFRVMEGRMTMGMLVAFQSLMVSFMTPFNQLVNLGTTLQEAAADMERLDDVENYPVERQYRPDASFIALENFPEPRLQGAIEIENLCFGYSAPEKPLIENFSLSLKPGSRVALVGGSGSGKSTIAGIVAGLYHPRSGTIRFDGLPAEEIPPEMRHNSIAMVDQEIFIFAGTVRENITMWDEVIPDEQVVAAAKDAFIHDDIAARAGGYGSEVAEGGTNFSGGQRQRLEIARAFVRNPSILILDEATSALDARMEKIVDDNIRRRGCTALIVAHRLSTIRDCDEIIVLDQGKIVQRGTHEEMAGVDGPYYELIHSY
ncbi:MAG: NHLP family bacteriocin export ABC transporter peptidase/permease/ATPase subunit [Deltaproteobacteria bacterium]|nr:MAG: NHLP family bacteriocin export ABC transporter peptidase/permease/ATPase subunit [Deltaproteobacteria bacterium]